MTGETEKSRRPGALLEEPLKVVNVGLESFARELEAQGVPVIQVAWVPTAGGDAKLANLLSKLGA